MPTNLQKLENDGYYIPEPICDTALIGELKNLLSNLQADDNDAVRKKNGDIFGVRNVLSISPVLWPMIKGSPIFKMAQELLGDNARINGGFFILSPKVFDYIEGDHISWEREPLELLASEGEVSAYKHDGFWQSMDTLRDKILLEELWESKKASWKVW